MFHALGESAILTKGSPMGLRGKRTITWVAVVAMLLVFNTGCDDDGETETGAGGIAMGGAAAMGGTTGMGGEPTSGGAPSMGGAPAFVRFG